MESKEIRMKKSDMIQRVNTVLVSVGCTQIEIIRKLFSSQCTYFYGAEAWKYADKSVAEFQTTWNRCVRRLLRLPNTTHRNLLPSLIGQPTALNQIYARFVKLIKNMLQGHNARIDFLTRLCLEDQRSIIGSNFHVIAQHLSIPDNCVLDNFYKLKTITAECDMISVILELIDFRNGDCFIQGFTTNEIDFIMHFVCTM